MTNTVRGALNAKALIGISVATTDHEVTPVITQTILSDSSSSAVRRLRVTVTGGPCHLYFNLGNQANVANDVAASQPDIEVDDPTLIAVGDHVMIYNNAYAAEYGTVSLVNAVSNIVTLTANVVGTYTTTAVSRLVVVPHDNAYAALATNASFSEDGLDVDNVYIRKTSAANATATGYAITG